MCIGSHFYECCNTTSLPALKLHWKGCKTKKYQHHRRNCLKVDLPPHHTWSHALSQVPQPTLWLSSQLAGESDYIHLTLAVLQSRIRLQWWRVCVCLSARLGGEWQPLLLLEHQPDELDGRWRFLQDEGCSSRIGYLYYYQWLCAQGKGQKTYVPSLDWGVGPGSRGRLEVGRL